MGIDTKGARRKLSSAGFVLTGTLGVLYFTLSLGWNGIVYTVMFGTVALVGITLAINNPKQTFRGFTIVAVIATVSGVNRMTLHGPTNALALALVALGVAFSWKSYQYYGFVYNS